MRTIAIVLGDNDFGNTFRPLLEGLKDIIEYHKPFELTKENIDLIIRQSIIAYYIGYQYRFDLQNYHVKVQKTEEEHLNSIWVYLKDVKILFDEEAEADIASKDHDGGAWYLELQSGIISGY
jgi:hypothetical protein